MKLSVKLYVRHCPIGQHAKHFNTRPAGLLQPLPPPNGPWEAITMDFIEGCQCHLVAVDRLTKYAHFIPLKHPIRCCYCCQGVSGQHREAPWGTLLLGDGARKVLWRIVVVEQTSLCVVLDQPVGNPKRKV
jgi:hypothetical protein